MWLVYAQLHNALQSWQESVLQRPFSTGTAWSWTERTIAENWSHTATSICAGFVAGGIAGAVTTPMDCLRTRLQVSTDSQVTFSSTVRELIKERGWIGLMRGVWPRTFVSAPQAAIQLASYELVKQFASK